MKNLYMWDDVDQLTQNYHHYGALVIISDLNSERAFRQAIEDEHVHIEAVYAIPDRWFKVEALNDEVFVYPNAGCC